MILTQCFNWETCILNPEPCNSVLSGEMFFIAIFWNKWYSLILKKAASHVSKKPQSLPSWSVWKLLPPLPYEQLHAFKIWLCAVSAIQISLYISAVRKINTTPSDQSGCTIPQCFYVTSMSGIDKQIGYIIPLDHSNIWYNNH